VARARRSPVGGTIAHGFYTLSLAPKLLAELVTFEHFGFALNYGLNRVRFTSPLPVGDRVHDPRWSQSTRRSARDGVALRSSSEAQARVMWLCVVRAGS
jgi:acyl dehydratase